MNLDRYCDFAIGNGVMTPKTLANIYEYTVDNYNPEMESLIETDVAVREILALAMRFRDGGSIVYEINHSLAALFALTSSPGLQYEYVPFDSLAIKIPAGFGADRDSWIFIVKHEGTLSIIWDADVGMSPLKIIHEGDISLDMTEGPFVESDGAVNDRFNRLGVLAYRYIGNLIGFVTEHRECVEPKTHGRTGRVFSVRPPSDVVVTREFRAAASAAAAATSIAGVRRALSHVVRGHWRNQPVGEGRKERKLTWIRPHKRGDESLGRVVQRIERLTAEEGEKQ